MYRTALVAMILVLAFVIADAVDLRVGFLAISLLLGIEMTLFFLLAVCWNFKW